MNTERLKIKQEKKKSSEDRRWEDLWEHRWAVRWKSSWCEITGHGRVNRTRIRVPDHSRWSQSWKPDSVEKWFHRRIYLIGKILPNTPVAVFGSECALLGRYLSSWANMERWQSPKSKPQIFKFLSAEPVAIIVLSWIWMKTQGQSQGGRKWFTLLYSLFITGFNSKVINKV